MAIHKSEKIKIIVKPHYQATIIRLSLGLILLFFGVETASETSFGTLQDISLRSLLNIDIWIYEVFHDFEVAKSIVSIFSISLGALLFIGLFNRAVGIIIAILFLIGIVTEPQILSNPVISIFKKSINIAIIGSAISLIFSDVGALSIKSFLTAPKIENIEKAEIKNHAISRIITRISLSLTLLTIFLSIFFWISGNNIIWSHFFERLSTHFSYISLPLLASIVGSCAALLLFGVGTKFAAVTTGILFIIVSALNGLPAYSFLIIIGSAFSLIAGEEYLEISKSVDQHKKNKKHPQPVKKRKKRNLTHKKK